MFSTEFTYALEAAYKEASNRKHAYFCLEHLLFALLFDEEISKILKTCGANLSELKEDLEKFLDTHVEKIDSESDSINNVEVEPIQTPAVQRVLQKAIMQMHSAGKDIVTSGGVLAQIFDETDAHAVYFLHKQGISKLNVLECIAHSDWNDTDGIDTNIDLDADEKEEKSKNKALKSFTLDLTKLAEQDKLDPIIGRNEEIQRMLKILSRRQKNNPLLLGDPGVGKTAMSSALAQRIVSGEVPDSLADAKLFSLNVGTLIAGTKFRGEFEQRLKKIVEELTNLDNAILFIDEIHTIVGAGATGTGSMDAANLLKPALSSGKLRCIGSTTHEDYKKSFEKDRALNRRFSVINLDEPSLSQTIKILEGLKSNYEEHHKITYSHNALKAAAELSAKHINDRFLPDKAIDVIDEAGAANSLLPKNKRKKTVTEREIEKVVSQIARVPVKSVSSQDNKLLQSLESDLKAKVFGQDQAVSVVAQAIKRSRANLKADNKPVGCFLFAGPTGVGKTELAKSLSEVLSVPFHRFDMSEYMEKHAVARLIGAPPGYVGYEEGGILTDLVRKQPYSVLLIDEIEKAHEDIYNILLQVMDDAMLTDSHGKKADFRNVIIIMTTNAGSGKASIIGFGDKKSDSNSESAIKKLFKPEFRNRLDEIVYFESLDISIILKIVDKFINELEEQLKDKKVKFQLDNKVKEYLAKKGFDDLLGARPMQRLIQKEIKDPIADEILFGKLKSGGIVKLELKKGKLSFNYN